MINITDLMLIKEAASSVGLENGWTKDQINEYFEQTIIAIARGQK
jgi:hypothetical protein